MTMHETVSNTLRLLVLVVATTLLLAGTTACTSTRPVSATIVDVDGQPVEGALLYFEAYTSDGAFDFGFARSGEDGKAPPADSPALITTWRPGARIALAAFAQGKKPTVLYDQLGHIAPEGMTIQLRELPEEGGMRWEPRVAKLSFPFGDDKALFSRIEAPGAAPLRQAFSEAYMPLRRGEHPVLPAEHAKMEALERAMATTAAGEGAP